MDRDRIEAIRHRTKRRDEMRLAQDDAGFLLEYVDELEATKLSMHNSLSARKAEYELLQMENKRLQSRIEAVRKLANTIEIASKNIFNTRVSDLMLDWSNELREALGDK